MTPRWPDTFVVGAPRCGTSAMYEYLGQHPQVYMSPRKEPIFLDRDLPDLPGVRIGDPREYLGLFAGATDQRRVGEASPFYLYSAHASAAIRQQCPDARIIIMLRNPADTMYSMYWAWSYAGLEDSPTFEGAIDRAPDRSAARPSRFILGYRYLVRYAEHVERYLGVFGGSRVHVVIFDDLARDPAGVYRDICRFLNVSDGYQTTFALDAFRRAASRRPLSRRAARFVTSRSEVLEAAVGRRLAGRLRDWLRRWATVPPPPLRPDLRRQLQREFDPEIRRLSRLIDRDLSLWGR